VADDLRVNQAVVSSPPSRPVLATAVGAVRRGVDILATGMAYFSGALFLLVAFYTTVDVVGRHFGVFSAVTDEVSGYVLAVGTMFGLAYALKIGGHVRIDVLLHLMPPRLRASMDSIALALMGLFAFVLALFSWRTALQSWEIKARALGLLGAPLYIPQFLMAIGISILFLEAVVMLGVRVAEAFLLRSATGRPTTGAAVSEEAADRPSRLV